MIASGWQLFYFKLFKAALDELEQAVTKLAKQDPVRKAGSKTDVYEVFRRMLSRLQVPTGIKELLAESTS